MFVLLFSIGALPILLSSCGGSKAEPAGLGVRILAVDQQLDPMAFQPVIDSFKAVHSDLVVSVTTETLTSDEFVSRKGEFLSSTDVIIFPSILNHEMRRSLESFSPVSASDTLTIRLPRVLDLAYAAQEEGSLWAVPLTLDPIVMVTKRSASEQVGEDAPPSDWAKMELIKTLSLQNNQAALPLFVFTADSPVELTDAAAARLLAQGYSKYTLWDNSPEIPDWYKEELNAMANAIWSLRTYVLSDPSGTITEIPQVSDLTAFMNSPAFCTFARLSDVAKLTAEQRNLIFAFPTPAVNRIMVPAYGVAAAVSNAAQNPTLAEQLLHHLVQESAQSAQAGNTLPIIKWEDSSLLDRSFPSDTVFVPRETFGGTPEKTIIDFLNGKIDLEQFTSTWKMVYYIPESEVL